MTVISDLVATLRLDYADFNSGLNAASSSLSGFGNVAAGVTTGQIALGAAIGDVAVVLGQALVASLQTSMAMMYQFNNVQQDLKTRFDTLTQSDFFGSAFTNSVIDFANQYGLKLQDVGNAAVQLLNVMGPLASTPQIWLSIADAAEMSGKSMSVLSDQLVKISQLLSSGGTSLVGPGMISRQLLGEGLSEAQIQQVTAMGKAGASANDIFQTLATMLEDKFAMAAANASQNTSHLVASIEQLTATDMTTAFEPAIKGLDGLLSKVKEWLSTAQGKNFFKDIADDAKGLEQFLAPIAKDFGDLATTVGQVAVEFGQMLAPLASVVPAVIQLVGAIAEFVSQHPVILQIIGAFIAFEVVSGIIMRTVAAVEALQATITMLTVVFGTATEAQGIETASLMAQAEASSFLVAAKATLMESEIALAGAALNMQIALNAETAGQYQNAIAAQADALALVRLAEANMTNVGASIADANATNVLTGSMTGLSGALGAAGLLLTAHIMLTQSLSSLHGKAAEDANKFTASLSGDSVSQQVTAIQDKINQLKGQVGGLGGAETTSNPLHYILGIDKDVQAKKDEIKALGDALTNLQNEQKNLAGSAKDAGSSQQALADYLSTTTAAANTTSNAIQTLQGQVNALTAQTKDLQNQDRIIKNQEAQATAADRVATASIAVKDSQNAVNDSVSAFNQIMNTGESDPYLKTLTSIEKLTPAQRGLGDEFRNQVAIYNQLNSALDAMTDKNTALTSALTQANDQIKIQEDGYEGVNNQYQNMSNQLSIINDQIKQQQDLWTPALTDNQRAQDAIKLQIDQLMAAGHFDKEPVIITLKNQLAVLQNQADQMKLKETLSTPMVDLQNQAQTLTSNMDNLKPTIDANKASLDLAKQSTQAISNQIDALKPQLDAAQQLFNTEKQKVDALNTAITTLVSSDQALQSANKSLYDAMKSSADAARQAVIDDNNAIIQSYKDIITAAQAAGSTASAGMPSGGGSSFGATTSGSSIMGSAAGIQAAQSAGISPVDSYSGGTQDNPQANFSMGQSMAAAMGWTGPEWTALANLWIKESGWQAFAKNPTSGAYGIPQSLPANKMAANGSDYLTNPATQIAWGLNYIKGTYGDPITAMAHETRFNWYDSGGYLPPGISTVVNNTGSPEPVLTPGQWNSLARSGSSITIAPGAVSISITSDAVTTQDVANIVENALDNLLNQIRARS